MANVGFYGKIPSQGDFVRVNAADPVCLAFDQWMAECLDTSQRAGVPLPQEPVNFLFRTAGAKNVLVGAFSPSSDSVGRQYPMVVFALIDLPSIAVRYPAVSVLYGSFFAAAYAIIGQGLAPHRPPDSARWCAVCPRPRRPTRRPPTRSAVERSTRHPASGPPSPFVRRRGQRQALLRVSHVSECVRTGALKRAKPSEHYARLSRRERPRRVYMARNDSEAAPLAGRTAVVFLERRQRAQPAHCTQDHRHRARWCTFPSRITEAPSCGHCRPNDRTRSKPQSSSLRRFTGKCSTTQQSTWRRCCRFCARNKTSSDGLLTVCA